MLGSVNSWMPPIAEKNAASRIAGTSAGSLMLHAILNCPAPSIAAAS